MSTGFRLFLLTLVGFLALLAYRTNSDEVRFWLGLEERRSGGRELSEERSPLDRVIAIEDVAVVTIRGLEPEKRKPQIAHPLRAQGGFGSLYAADGGVWDPAERRAEDPIPDIAAGAASDSLPAPIEGLDREPPPDTAWGPLGEEGGAGWERIPLESERPYGSPPALPAGSTEERRLGESAGEGEPGASAADRRGAVEGSERTEAGAGAETAPYRTYRVREGDNLWKIADRELGRGTRWTEIRDAQGEKPNPDRYLQPGEELRLPAR